MNGFFHRMSEFSTSQIFSGVGAIIGGIFLSTAIVGYFVYDKGNKYDKHMNNTVGNKEKEEDQFKREAREIKEKKIRYGQLFYDELEALEDRELSTKELEDLSNKHIEEDTPEGKVIMVYNNNSETFWYYSKTKNVSNRTLDAVARRYAVTHDCKTICVNHKKEIERVQKKIFDMMLEKNTPNNEDETQDKEADDTNTSVFVKPKITKKKLIRRHNRVIVDHVNRFTYKGKLDEYKIVDEKKANKSNNEASKKMSFREYKEFLNKT